jgi:SAM-dependent methyltransferase
MEASRVEKFRGYPVMIRRYKLAGRTLELFGPANYEELVDSPEVARRFNQSEYMPYWAQPWPASLLLAEAVARWAPADAPPARVLDVGCGLGLVSLLASHLGYQVLAIDQDEDALAFLTESARRNNVPVPETRILDWQKMELGQRFDCIVAADVLYETRHLRPVAELVHDCLTPDGFGLIADPNRFTADEFDVVCRHCGLAVEVTPAQATEPAENRTIEGRIFRLSRKPEGKPDTGRKANPA